jgi:hypothetical protein
MAQRKETKTSIKVRDLKPKKDAKGGRVPSGGAAQSSGRNVQNRQANQANQGNLHI